MISILFPIPKTSCKIFCPKEIRLHFPHKCNQPKAGKNIFGRWLKQREHYRRNLLLRSWVPSKWTREGLFTSIKQDKEELWEDPSENPHQILHFRKYVSMQQQRSRGRSASVTCTDFTQGPVRGTELRELLRERKRVLLCSLLAKSQHKLNNRPVFKTCDIWRWKKQPKFNDFCCQLPGTRTAQCLG